MMFNPYYDDWMKLELDTEVQEVREAEGKYWHAFKAVSYTHLDVYKRQGVACTISTASTSIMSDLLKGKTLEEAKVIIANYYQMIDQQPYDPEMLEEAVAFHTVGSQANRIKCATIGWKAIEQLRCV